MEFTLAEIKDFAGSDSVFQQAQALVDEKKIVSFDIDDYTSQEIIVINATIKDDKQYMEVNMSVDKDDYVIKAHLCSCAKHQDDQLPCIHCVAILLKIYQDQAPLLKPTNNVSTLQDPWALSLLNAYEEAIVYSTLAMNLKQSIHLEPVLEIRKHDILALTLKVGEHKQYIIKDIAIFLEDVRSNVRKQYGKELSFLHNRNSFDATSQILLDFLYAHEHDTAYFLNHAMYRECPQVKNVCLNKHALDEFFTLYIGEDIMYRIREKTLTNMRFLDENPPFVIDVKKQGDAYQIGLSDYAYQIFEGLKNIYILHHHILYRCDPSFGESCLSFLQTMRQKQDALYISEEHMAGFYNNVFMRMKKHIPVQGVDLSAFAPLPLVCRLYVDVLKRNTVSTKLIYAYGAQTFNAFSIDTMSASRNFNEEIAVRLILSRYMSRVDANEGYAYIENSQDAMYEFLSRGMEELSEHCEIYVSDSLKAMQIKDNFHVSMGVRITSNLLEIDFNTYEFPVDELAEVLKAYRLNKKYYRMKNGTFVNIEDSALSELSSILEGMHVNAKQLASGHLEVDTYRSLYLDKMMKHTDVLQVERDASFKDIIRNIHNYQDQDFQVPNCMKDILRNYQKSGFRWLKTMKIYGFCGVLADDMGIGKTIQMIALLQDEKDHNPAMQALVICPSSLLLNWEHEIDKFSQNVSSLLITGSIEERKALIQKHQDYDVLITSYDYLKRDLELYEDIHFTYQILDEAQYIKNHTTKNAQSVKQIHAAHKFALTGTPIENSLAELWSIFDFLMPGYLYNYAYFKGVYEAPIVKDNDRSALVELRRMVEPFILRRVKKDVLKELPEKVENTLLVELDEEARKLYMANVALIKQDVSSAIEEKGLGKSRIIVLTMLTRLRQLCCDPRLLYDNYRGTCAKLDACMELIDQCVESGKKVLLFSQFTSLLALIEDALHDRGIPYYLLKGSTPKAQRQQLVNSFNSDQTPVFLISLKAGGTGLNLTSAEVVIHFDPWWNISAQNQATDRAYRIGQHNNVQVFKLIVKDTIEEKIMELQEQKKDLGDSIISQSDGTITSMSQKEIMDLF